MMSTASAAQVTPASRFDRRKARTRQALIDAAARLIAEGPGEAASIQDHREGRHRIRVVLQHFTSKKQLFQVAWPRCSSAGGR